MPQEPYWCDESCFKYAVLGRFRRKSRKIYSHQGRYEETENLFDPAQGPASHWQEREKWRFCTACHAGIILEDQQANRFVPLLSYAWIRGSRWGRTRWVEQDQVVACFVQGKWETFGEMDLWLAAGVGDAPLMPLASGFSCLPCAKEAFALVLSRVEKEEAEADEEDALAVQDAAEELFRDQMRDVWFGRWEEQYGVLFATHLVTEYDARHFAGATGALDPLIQQREEERRRLLLRIYHLPDDASWETIRGAIERDRQVGK